MYERTVRPLTEAELARLRRQRELMRATMTGDGGIERGVAACGSAFGAVAGMLVALFLWSAGGRNGNLAAWLLTGGLLGGTWGYALGRGAGKAMAGCGSAALTGETDDADLQAAVLRCTVTGAVAVPMCGAGELLVLDVGDGRLLALNTVVGYGTRLTYLGFPHERFELTVLVGSLA
ncbi:MAG: hypothetical protein HYU66_28195, partial [Armatimonadetes bacterium]|nr:hypothetical protein [Armatimonadota bacterium]